MKEFWKKWFDVRDLLVSLVLTYLLTGFGNIRMIWYYKFQLVAVCLCLLMFFMVARAILTQLKELKKKE